MKKDTVINRITINEKRFDIIQDNINRLDELLNSFKNNKKELDLLNKYYGSKTWFKDKDSFEKNIIPRIKAGVLSEDAIWNLNDDIKELISEMKKIIDIYENK